MYVSGDINTIAQEALLDAVAGPAFFVDGDYRYLAFNEADRKAVKVLYGSDLDVGASLFDVVTVPADREVLKAHIDRALAGQTHGGGGWYGREPSSRYYYTITFSPVRSDGRVIGVAAVAVDATELLEVYEAVSVLSDVVESSDDAVATWNKDGMTASWNPGAERLTGYAAAEKVGRPMDPLVAPGREADYVAVMARVASGEKVEHFATEMVRKDGSRVSVELSVTPILDENGTVIGGTGIARNVDERRSMAEALFRSEQKFEAAFRSSPDAININRLSDGMYVEINAGFTAVTGYTECDVEGKTSLDLSVWDDVADRARLVEGLRTDGVVDRLEARFRRKDGSITVAEMSARIIEVDGDPYILSVTRDISERKQVLADLEASNQRLAALSKDVVQTLGRLVETRDPYTQGHECRTADLCLQIAKEMGIGDSGTDALETAALLHDIGKMTIPAEILTKPGELSAVEWALIREHPQASHDILKGIAFEWPIAELVLQHHERMDGSGYPRGLSGDQIEMDARILAVADVVEAMVSHRPYRAALGLEAAAEELRAHPEKYDSRVVAAVLSLCDGHCLEL